MNAKSVRTITLAFLLASSAAATAEARPEYNKVFWEHYAKQLGTLSAKCGACHSRPDKKSRNNYANVLKTKLGAANVKDHDQIRSALEEAAKEPSAIRGKTFGDLINEGKLPGTQP
jgi:hypothetical protein